MCAETEQTPGRDGREGTWAWYAPRLKPREPTPGFEGGCSIIQQDCRAQVPRLCNLVQSCSLLRGGDLASPLSDLHIKSEHLRDTEHKLALCGSFSDGADVYGNRCCASRSNYGG